MIIIWAHSSNYIPVPICFADFRVCLIYHSSFSRWRVCRSCSCVMWLRIDWYRFTDVSEERAVSVSRTFYSEDVREVVSFKRWYFTTFHVVTFQKNLIVKRLLISNNRNCGMWSTLENIPFSYCKRSFLFLGWWRVNSTARRPHVATVHYKSNRSCGESWFMLPLNWKPALYLWNDCRFISSTCLIYCNMT